MASQIDTVSKTNRTLMSKLDSKSSSSTKAQSKEPALKFNLEEFRELKNLETAGDTIGVQNLKKKVRRRMELELSSGPTTTTTISTGDKNAATSNQVKSKSAASKSSTAIKNGENTPVNQKIPETTVSASKRGNKLSNGNEDKIAVKKEKSMTTTLKSTGKSLTLTGEKHDANKEKPKSHASASKIIRGDLASNKGKQTAIIHQKMLISSTTSTSKSTSSNLSKNKSKQAVTSKDSVCDLSINNDKRSSKERKKLEMCVERWKLRREKGGKYEPLELFLTPDVLNDKNQMVIVEKIAKEFELKRLRRLLEQDMERPNGNKKQAQERIEHLNNFGKSYTRLEIATARNEKGPKNDQKIRDYIAFLNEKKVIKHKTVTSLDIIEDPYCLRRCTELLQGDQLKQYKERFLQKDSEFNLRHNKLEEEKKRRRQQKLEAERKHEKPEGKLLEQRRHKERTIETKRLQGKEPVHRQKVSPEEVRLRRNRMADDLRSNASRKVVTNRNDARNDASTSISLKKRKFDERSEFAPSKAQKRRNVGDGELDICEMDEATLNRNLSTIIHSIVRPGRRPIYGMIDDNDNDDIMEVSGYEVLREEARSSRIARKEDDEEERAEQRRRMKKLQSKKAQR